MTHLPVVYSQTLATTAGTPLTITLTGSDVDGNTLGWAIVMHVKGGSIRWLPISWTTSTIDVVFTPASGFTGTSTFNFYATDGSSMGNTAAININVSSAPTPIPSTASTPAPSCKPTPTSTPIPNIFNAPSTSGWGLIALIAVMLLVMAIRLRVISVRRQAGNP